MAQVQGARRSLRPHIQARAAGADARDRLNAEDRRGPDGATGRHLL